MTTTSRTDPALLAEALGRYVRGVPPETRQFAFFIGDWDCQVLVHAGGGAEPTRLRGHWHAEWLHDGRMLLDDLTLFLPSGEEADAWITLRTWAPETGQWEIVGLRALAPASGARTTGQWRDGEMHLAFETDDPGGATAHRIRFSDLAPDGFRWAWTSRPAGDPDAAWTPFASIVARRVSRRPGPSGRDSRAGGDPR